MALGLDEDTIRFLKNHKDDIKQETVENLGAAATAYGVAKNRASHVDMLNPKKIVLRKGLRVVPGLSMAIGSLVDAYQGRENAAKVFGPNPTIGQRAAGVGSSIANGLSLGLFGLNDPKNVRNTYYFYKEKFK